jgi:hypothetical protein
MRLQVEKAFTVSLILSIYFNMALVVLKELHTPFKGFLKNYLMHHWVGHGLVLLIFFTLLGLLLNRLQINPNLKKVPFHLVLSMLVSSIGISMFYLNHVH